MRETYLFKHPKGALSYHQRWVYTLQSAVFPIVGPMVHFANTFDIPFVLLAEVTITEKTGLQASLALQVAVS